MAADRGALRPPRNRPQVMRNLLPSSAPVGARADADPFFLSEKKISPELQTAVGRRRKPLEAHPAPRLHLRPPPPPFPSLDFTDRRRRPCMSPPRLTQPSAAAPIQAESAIDQLDWIEKITGVIASLLSSQSPDQCSSPVSNGHHRTASDSSFGSLSDLENSILEESSLERNLGTGHSARYARNSQQRYNVKHEKPIDVLREVSGNDICADCGAYGPDWASLNLGILVCIECSGVHRNLGVHISKVRSLTLDIKAWEPSVINLFQSLGNIVANSIWEELLPSTSDKHENNASFCKLDRQQHTCTSKPNEKTPAEWLRNCGASDRRGFGVCEYRCSSRAGGEGGIGG